MPKAKKPLNARQQEIVDLAKSEMSAADIAQVLQSTPNAIHQQISRLRAAGHLPKTNGRGRKLAPATVTRQTGPTKQEPEFDEMIPPLSNGSLTLEEHLSKELEGVISRLSEVATQRTALAEEESTLTERQQKLEKASAALAA